MVLERDDWARVDALLQAALDLEGEARERFVEAETGGDASLRRRLLELIHLAESEGSGDGQALRPGGALAAAGLSPIAADEPAPLSPGSRLGRYQIRALLGAGGMGRVYRALDPTLDREVALKALAQTFRNDSGSLRRFEREAKVLAALSHPNIAAIYGFEELDGDPYLVLEKVEGDTLADRLSRGALPLREAVAIAVQVADGLAEAHRKGVVHRDLKPSNVMITPAGRVKLVDFGLAKTTGTSSAAVPSNLTTAIGTVVGTAPYMSPEQIRGEEVDTRTDVWAFGCLLYEMLVGKQAFTGRSVPEVLASVLRDEPDLELLSRDRPAGVRRLVQRCLRKDPDARIQHIGDARLELVDLSAEMAPGGLAPRTAPVGVLSRWPRRPRVAAAAAALAFAGLRLAGRWAWRQRPGPASATAARPLAFSLELPRGLTFARELGAPFTVSPDGTTLVLEGMDAGTSRLLARGLDDVAVRPIAGTERGRQPLLSPDGRSVAFFADRKLLRVPLEGGTPLPLCDVGSNARGAAWPRDGTIVFSPSQSSPLSTVPATGGAPSPLTTLDVAHGERSHRWPVALPGGRWVLFSVGFEGWGYDDGRIDAVSLDTRERRTVLAGGAYAHYVSSGHLVFVRGGRVLAVPFDPESLKTSGTPEVVLSGVRYDPQNGSAYLALSPSGTLVYEAAEPVSPETYLVWLHRDGRRQRLTEAPRLFRDPRVSPDGSRVAVVIGTSSGSDLWLVDGSGGLTQLSFGLSPHRPTWLPDGRHVTVAAEKGGRWRLVTLAVDGKGEERLLLDAERRVYPNAWSPDGRSLVYQESTPASGWNLRLLAVDGTGTPSGAPRDVAASPFQEANASISPDGRWIAYESDELDSLFQAHVRSFPDGDVKLRGSTTGARFPSWDHERRLYYWDTSSHRLLEGVTRERGGALQIGEGRPVFPAEGGLTPALSPIVISVTGASFDTHPSGERFLMLETSAATLAPAFTWPLVVVDWSRRLAAPRSH